MQNLLSQFVAESLIVEKSRYERETGLDSAEELRQKIKSLVSAHPCNYAFTMIQIPKIGLNPKTSYETPAGVYFYPLNKYYYKRLVDNTLPFVSDNPYFGVVKLKHLDEQDKWLKFIDAGVSYASSSILKTLSKTFDISYDKMTLRGKHNSFSTDARIFDITYFESQKQSKDSGQKSTSIWNKILRSHGIIGIYDAGNGIIHPAENTQLVCLSPEAYETVGIWETKELRKKKVTVDDIKNATNAHKKYTIIDKTTDIEILKIFANDKDDQVRCVLARKLKCPIRILKILANDNDSSVRFYVAENLSCTPEILNILASDENDSTRCCVAENPNCSPETLDFLSRDANPTVRSTVTINTNTPKEVLFFLAKDKDEYVSNYAQKSITKKEKN